MRMVVLSQCSGWWDSAIADRLVVQTLSKNEDDLQVTKSHSFHLDFAALWLHSFSSLTLGKLMITETQITKMI